MKSTQSGTYPRRAFLQSMAAALLGSERPVRWTPAESGLTVAVPPLPADELPCEHAYTIRLTHIEGNRSVPEG